MPLKPISQLRFDYDTTIIPRRTRSNLVVLVGGDGDESGLWESEGEN